MDATEQPMQFVPVLDDPLMSTLPATLPSTWRGLSRSDIERRAQKFAHTMANDPDINSLAELLRKQMSTNPHVNKERVADLLRNQPVPAETVDSILATLPVPEHKPLKDYLPNTQQINVELSGNGISLHTARYFVAYLLQVGLQHRDPKVVKANFPEVPDDFGMAVETRTNPNT